MIMLPISGKSLSTKLMGGVDLADRGLNNYRVAVRSKRWYFVIVTYLLDLAMYNAWRLFLVGGKETSWASGEQLWGATYKMEKSWNLGWWRKDLGRLCCLPQRKLSIYPKNFWSSCDVLSVISELDGNAQLVIKRCVLNAIALRFTIRNELILSNYTNNSKITCTVIEKLLKISYKVSF